MTLVGHLLAEIRERGPITGLDFKPRLRARALTRLQRLLLTFTSPYLFMWKLEEDSILTSYREPRPIPCDDPRFNTRLMFRLREEPHPHG